MLASFMPNKKAKILTTICDIHIFPLGDVKFEPIPHSQNVLFMILTSMCTYVYTYVYILVMFLPALGVFWCLVTFLWSRFSGLAIAEKTI